MHWVTPAQTPQVRMHLGGSHNPYSICQPGWKLTDYSACNVFFHAKFQKSVHRATHAVQEIAYFSKYHTHPFTRKILFDFYMPNFCLIGVISAVQLSANLTSPNVEFGGYWTWQSGSNLACESRLIACICATFHWDQFSTSPQSSNKPKFDQIFNLNILWWRNAMIQRPN